ncbi:hypothetical protein F2P81_004178 [Scophthalmus maximus]|uniref:Uncharacterized protein n=1 Tax=Scophthalmus maximus TaxID=52904 RepID=A0A6A4TJ01_SCOMX|nr:hypothetical protein F2P81_004178 [Scophthalmus maximus]
MRSDTLEQNKTSKGSSSSSRLVGLAAAGTGPDLQAWHMRDCENIWQRCCHLCDRRRIRIHSLPYMSGAL